MTAECYQIIPTTPRRCERCAICMRQDKPLVHMLSDQPDADPLAVHQNCVERCKFSSYSAKEACFKGVTHAVEAV